MVARTVGKLREAILWSRAPLSFGRPRCDVADHCEASGSPCAMTLTMGSFPKPRRDIADQFGASGSPGAVREG